MKAIEAIEHITTEGERWDTLAWRYYGDPYAYSRIVEANPALDLGPVLPSGQLLLIPILPLAQASQQLTDDSLPPWKR